MRDLTDENSEDIISHIKMVVLNDATNMVNVIDCPPRSNDKLVKIKPKKNMAQ